MIVNQRSLYSLRIILDLLMLNLAFVMAAVLAQSLPLLIERNHMFILQMGLNILWYFSTAVTGFYDDLNSRYLSFQFSAILKNVIVQALAAVFFIFIVKENLFTRNFIVYYFFLLTLFIVLRHLIFSKTLTLLRRQGKNIRNLVIIGAGEIGLNFYNVLRDHPDFGYNFAGFIDDKNDVNSGEGIIGHLDDLEDIFRSYKIDEAVIALSQNSSLLLDQIISACNRSAVKAHIIPDYFRYMSKKFRISMLGDFPIISVRNEPLDEVQWRFVKRSFDIFFSLLVIILILWWLIPLLSLIIKSQSKGSAMFVQERIGQRNRKFLCYKFRTMYIENNQQEKFKPATGDDPRITPVGHLLRKTNIDELPQFINVFKGDMSVVGPRPHPLPFDKKYSQIVDVIKMRHNVKPGITGWAQVHGLRGDETNELENSLKIMKRIEYDLWYIENWSVWLDIQIVLMTIWQIIRGEAKGL